MAFLKLVQKMPQTRDFLAARSRGALTNDVSAMPHRVQMVVLIGMFLQATSARASGFADGGPQYWPKYGGNRDVTLLDGEWEYGYTPSNIDSMSPGLQPRDMLTPNKTVVPSCMDVVAGGAPGYLGPRGVSYYRTNFAAPESGAAARLQFQSCSFYCRVWVNGFEVGDHRAGGYVAFWMEVDRSLLTKGSNELLVLADNRFNHTTAPMHTGGDFWHYGGLTRSVELHAMQLEPVLWRAYALPAAALNTLNTAPESVDITLVFSGAVDGPVAFLIQFDGGSPVAYSEETSGSEVHLTDIPVPNPLPWSPADPNLHTMTVAYRGGTVTERFGLRTFGVDKDSARFTVNGEILKLVGWNHHSQWPVTAASPTDGQLDSDVALLKQGSANYVRGAHYPHDPRMLDRLDENGILFWSETLGPAVTVENMQDWDFFMKYQLQQLQQMIENAMNHAAVFTWGWFNEGPSDQPAACAAYAACSNYSQKRDPSRFTTWADNKELKGVCFEHATLVALNNYPGWYTDAGDKKAPMKWNNLADEVRAGGTKSGKHTVGKPMVISETGAGGIYEWDRNATDAKWTLMYQTEIIAGDVDAAISNANVSGITLWHFYDFKVDNCGASWPCESGPGQENNTHCEYDHEPPTTFAALAKDGPPNCTWIDIDHRPGGENHKGSVDFWRRPKPVFDVVAAKYKSANNEKPT